MHQVLLDIGNINTFARMYDKSGSWSRTVFASSLKFVGRWGVFELGIEQMFLDNSSSKIKVLLVFSGNAEAGLGLRSSFSKPATTTNILIEN